MVSCDHTLISALLEQTHYPRTCTITFAMPGNETTFEIDCQVVTHRRLSQNHFYLVMLFSKFTCGGNGMLIESLKDSHLENTA